MFYRLGLAAEHFRYFCGRVRDKTLCFRPADRVRIIEVLYKNSQFTKLTSNTPFLNNFNFFQRVLFFDEK